MEWNFATTGIVDLTLGLIWMEWKHWKKKEKDINKCKENIKVEDGKILASFNLCWV